MQLKLNYMKKFLFIISVLTFIALWTDAEAQHLVHVEVDSVACVGDSVRIGVGFNAANEVQVQDLDLSATSVERAFLPDGVSCEPYGCKYRSTVTFSGFTPGAQLQSAQDIKYVRLNIEHSYLGDLYIGLVCPSGQKADIVKFSEYSNNTSLLSPCLSDIPASSRGWATPDASNNRYAYLGVPMLTDDFDAPCSTSSNTAGTGWNYCWSNNNASGFSYSGGSGYVYRTVNQSYVESRGGMSYYRVDSSNVAAGSNFYHPDQNFSSLVGCPINGQWYIEVIDGVKHDNGWVFDWELKLDEALVPAGGTYTGATVIGDSVVEVNDSLWMLVAPSGVAADTTIDYTVRIFGTGLPAQQDTTVRVHWNVTRYGDTTTVLCVGDSVMWNGLKGAKSGAMAEWITTDTVVYDTLTASTGCDSIVRIEFQFYPGVDVYDTAAFCRNEPFIWGGTDYGGPTEFTVSYTDGHGCDSLVHVRLEVLDSTFIPHLLLSDDGQRWGEDTTLLGCEPYKVWLKDTTGAVAERAWIVESGSWSAESTEQQWWVELDTARVYSVTLTLTSLNGCRDTQRADSAIWVFRNPKSDFDWLPVVPAIHNPEVQFRNFSRNADGDESGVTYLWEIENHEGGGYDTLSEREPAYHWGEPTENMQGEYTVRLQTLWMQAGPDSLYAVCIDTLEREVTIVNDWLQFPSLVTPNGDGINDRWEVVNLVEWGVYSMNEIWIYNEWGALVFHAKNVRRKEDFWDPNATNSPDGTYYFRFMGKGEYGITKNNGTIEVLR